MTLSGSFHHDDDIVRPLRNHCSSIVLIRLKATGIAEGGKRREPCRSFLIRNSARRESPPGSNFRLHHDDDGRTLRSFLSIRWRFFSSPMPVTSTLKYRAELAGFHRRRGHGAGVMGMTGRRSPPSSVPSCHRRRVGGRDGHDRQSPHSQSSPLLLLPVLLGTSGGSYSVG